QAAGQRFEDAASVQLALIEAIVDTTADRLEFIGQSLDQIDHSVFRLRKARPHPPRLRPSRRTRVLEIAIEELGEAHHAAAKLRDSMLSLHRLVAFSRVHADAPAVKGRLAAVEDDLKALAEYDAQLSGNIDFMLNAAVGLVDIQQNKAIYILS